MFFDISQQYKQNYPCHYKLGNFCISTDQGWHYSNIAHWSVIYKGYAEADTLNNLLGQIVDQQEPDLLGNFCVLAYNNINNTLKIQTDRYRSFPIYNHGKEITNLTPGYMTYWSDGLIEINEEFSVAHTEFDIIGKIEDSELTVDQVAMAVTEILETRVENFLQHNRLPIRAFLSGGVDSLLVYSFLQKHTNNYEMVKSSHIDYDYFWVHNEGALQSKWAYKQIHHWIEPCILSSGAPGDEFTLRSPTTAHIYLNHHNLDSYQELQKRPNCFHNYYYSLDKHVKIFSNTDIPQFQNKQQLIHYLCNIVINDWQHHHLGNTLTWTPLRDIEIYKLILRLPLNDAVEQIFNSAFSIRLIEQKLPGAGKLLSTQKNDLNPMKNLVKLLDLSQ
jgi:hypothetical protein